MSRRSGLCQTLRCIAFSLPLVLPATGFAQTLPEPPPLPDPTPPGETGEGFDLFRDGADMMLRGFLGEVGPALRDLVGRLDDLHNYDPPVILDNGDILMRRKADAPPYKPPPKEGSGPQVDL